MGRRGLGNASGIARMWAFVALSLGILSFMQGFGFVRSQISLATEVPVESCNLESVGEYDLDDLDCATRADIEALTGLPRLDLSQRPVSIQGGVNGVVLTTEYRRNFRLFRQIVVRQRKSYFPLIGQAMEPCAGIPIGQERFVIVLGPNAVEQLKQAISPMRAYCTDQQKAAPLPLSK
jgi:hypothetical protein